MRIGEHNFIRQLQLHNEKALVYVIDAYGGLLKSIIRKQLYCLPERQEECMDDVLLNIWQNISDFDETRNSFKNWAAAIARYRAVDYLRQYQRELMTVDIEGTAVAKEDKRLAAVMEQEISEEVEKMLDCLKPMDRELFLRLYVDTIYQLLNDVETDFSKYEQDELSVLEKDRHKQTVLREVKRMKNKKMKAWKIAAGAAAACAVTVGTVSLANPVFANEIFSSVFGSLVENARGSKYEKEDTTTLKTEDEGLNKADGILARIMDDGNKGNGPAISIDGTQLAGYSERSFEKTKDGSFVAMNQIDLMSPADSREKEIDLGLDEKGTLVVNWDLSEFSGYLWDQWDDSGEYMKTGETKGQWNLRFPVTIDRSHNQTYAVNKEDNGVQVKNAVKTKAGLVLEVELPDFTKAPYNDPYNDPDLAVKDSSGKCLQWINQKTMQHDDGTATMQIMVLYDGEKDLSFEVTTKDEDQIKLADISFQIP